jgi:class 3 adenylate cyclase
MAQLSARDRARLPDSAFAYIDSKGKRRLPINDASHVRNALARFGQVAFEDVAARDVARSRLLRAAKKHGIMPIGFISSQLRQKRPRLPTGDVTFLLTDIEGSTDLLAQLEDAYAHLLDDIRRLVRAAIEGPGGHEVSARGDDVFSVFEGPADALRAAYAIQRGMRDASWPGGRDVRLRIGLHRGRPQLTDVGYVGLSVHAAARICFSAHGGQTIMSEAVHSALPEPVTVRSLGPWRFRGLPEPISIFQAEAPDLPSEFPALRSAVPAT